MLTADGYGPLRALSCNVSFSDERDGLCRIRVSWGRFFKRRRSWSATVEEAAALENWLVQRLTAPSLLKPKVSWRTDFYGGQWLEIRRGWWGRNYIRATPNRLIRLGEALNLPD